eukprot:TRINITY_DN21758_c0_g1_i1.p1 TRINITY_DN21758_c0_g1~~TRINITY_DN21758_c0_g1_i1.p1  ORF type:complete len:1309 (+),score=244.55 TRINITY_DN21758_c0_g1_i1:129-3929(+)
MAPWQASRDSCSTFRRLFGFISRATVITMQRVLDVVTVCEIMHSGHFSIDWMILLVFLILTTVLMAVTMKKSWSAFHGNRPHGAWIGCLTALFQVAPLWESCDKLLFHGLVQDGRASEDAAAGANREPLLQASVSSTPPKGSAGEYMMRGVRKMSMVNLPQAMASLWCHIYDLMPVYPMSTRTPSRGPAFLTAAFAAALICVVFGTADFVLYVWVDDAFLRSNKKLATFHYMAEILSRVPIVVLFHLTYSRLHNYWPTVWLLLGDMCITSLLLVGARIFQARQRGVCRGTFFSVNTLAQVLYSLIVSFPLTFVNIVFFDPGMSFFYVNQVFYVIKYIELVIMWLTVDFVRRWMYASSGILYGMPHNAYGYMWRSSIFFTTINFVMVFVVVPCKRAVKVQHLLRLVGSEVDMRPIVGAPPPEGDIDPECGNSAVDPEAAFEDASAAAAEEAGHRSVHARGLSCSGFSSVSSPRGFAGSGGQSLQRLGEIFEMLWLVSRASFQKNRRRVLEMTVNDLWLQALCWDGLYDDPSTGSTVQVALDANKHSLVITPQQQRVQPRHVLQLPSLYSARRPHKEPGEDAARDSIGGVGGVVFDSNRSGQGTHMVGQLAANVVNVGGRRGFFDGRRIYWDDGAVWARHVNEASGGDCGGAHSGGSSGHAVMRLLLPQLVLALRWDEQASPGSGAVAGSLARVTSQVGKQSFCNSPTSLSSASMRSRSPQSPFEEASRFQDDGAVCAGRPLLDFLVRYALIGRKADFLSDLYWTLVCLSRDDRAQARRNPRGGGVIPNSGEDGGTYGKARRALLQALCDEAHIELWPAAMREVMVPFVRASRKLLINQREIWRQHMELFTKHSGRTSGGGSWKLRTQVLRRALRNWTHHQASSAAAGDEDDQLLQRQRYLPPPTALLSLAVDAAEENSRPLGGSRGGGGAGSDAGTIAPGLLEALKGDADEGSRGLISLAIDPETQFCGVVIEESEVIPSKQAPLMLTCRTKSALVSDEAAERREKYLLKFGDDLRQDQLMLQLMSLMACGWREKLGPGEAARLRLAQFKVLAVTPTSGYIKCVPDAVPLSTALHQSQGHLDVWLDQHKPKEMSIEEVLDNLCGSVAASCVVTYVLGIGDRHLENICITPTGIFFHIDFSFVLGDDPKPIAPSVRFPQQVAQALRRTNRLDACFGLAGTGYAALRPYVGLLSTLLTLTAEAGGVGCTKLADSASARAAIAGIRERLRVDEANDERAASEFLCLMRESSEGLASIILDKVHAAGLFWR